MTRLVDLYLVEMSVEKILQADDEAWKLVPNVLTLSPELEAV